MDDRCNRRPRLWLPLEYTPQEHDRNPRRLGFATFSVDPTDEASYATVTLFSVSVTEPEESASLRDVSSTVITERCRNKRTRQADKQPLSARASTSKRVEPACRGRPVVLLPWVMLPNIPTGTLITELDVPRRASSPPGGATGLNNQAALSVEDTVVVPHTRQPLPRNVHVSVITETILREVRHPRHARKNGERCRRLSVWRAWLAGARDIPDDGVRWLDGSVRVRRRDKRVGRSLASIERERSAALTAFATTARRHLIRSDDDASPRCPPLFG